MEWISVEERLPEPRKPVLIRQKTGYRENEATVVGQWIPAKSMESDADDDWFEYDESVDMHYVPEGWYERQINWGEFANIHIGEQVTHWRPLPAPPP